LELTFCSQVIRINSRKNSSSTGHSLGRNTIWNLFGSIVPLSVGLISIPIIIDQLGIERFGLLTIAWLTVGYFSLFDLGLGRALTKLVAEYRGAAREHEVPQLFWTSMVIMSALGVAGAVLLGFLAEPLINVLTISVNHMAEALAVIQLLALSLPIIIVTSGLRGVLEAYHQFRLINLIRIPVGVANFVLPIFILWFENSLPAAVVGIIASRVVLLVVYAGLVMRIIPTIKGVSLINGGVARELLQFGGWMTVSNLVGPLMTYMDGFVIGALLSVSAMAFYTIPYEVVTKLWVFPTAIIVSLFPLLSQKLVREKDAAKKIFFGSVRFLFFALFPLILTLVSFSNELLTFWLGSEFADKSTLILQFLLIGVFVNSIAMFPYGLLQSAGYPRYTAFLHLVELPLYCFFLVFLLNELGIVGAAIAWLMRVSLDSSLLIYIVCKCIPEFARGVKFLLIGQCLAVLTFTLVMFTLTPFSKIIVSVSVIVLTSIWGVNVLVAMCRAEGIHNIAAIRKLLIEN